MEREENNHCIGKRLLQEYDYSLAWCDSKTYVDLSYCTEAQKGKSWENWLISQDGIHWPYDESGQSLLGPHNRHWDVNYSPPTMLCDAVVKQWWEMSPQGREERKCFLVGPGLPADKPTLLKACPARGDGTKQRGAPHNNSFSGFSFLLDQTDQHAKGINQKRNKQQKTHRVYGDCSLRHTLSESLRAAPILGGAACRKSLQSWTRELWRVRPLMDETV